MYLSKGGRDGCSYFFYFFLKKYPNYFCSIKKKPYICNVIETKNSKKLKKCKYGTKECCRWHCLFNGKGK